MAEPIDILLVDDRRANLEALVAILERPDYRLVCAMSGEEALTLVLKHDFAVILMDVDMPGLNGFDTARLIKQRERSARVPILFVTAYVQGMEQVHLGYAVGAVDYLYKPIDTDVVRAKVAVFAELYRQREEIKRQASLLRESEKRERDLLKAWAERALRESEAQYEATFSHAPVGIAHLSLDGKWLRVNDRLCAIVGRTRDELLGSGLGDVVEDGARLLADWIAGTGGGRRHKSEQPLRHQNGTTLWAVLTASLLTDTLGTPTQLVLVVEDITERHWQEESQVVLAQASKLLLSGLDHRQTLSMLCELAVRAFADVCVVRTLGSERATFDVVAQHETRLGREVREADLNRIERASLSRALSTGNVIEIDEGVADGRVVRGVLAPLNSRSGVQGALCVLGVDVSERRAHWIRSVTQELAHNAAFAVENALLYDAARKAVAVREEFLSIAAHELRTPLTSLQLHIQRLARRRMITGPADEAAQSLERVDRQIRRLAGLIDSLMDVSRFRSGVLSLEREPVELASVVRDAASRFCEELSQQKCPIELSLAEELVGTWDRTRLEQVVTNLLSNALKYGAGGRIEVSSFLDGDDAVLKVRDHGIGIPPEVLPRLFERFERGVVSKGYGGLGLGLYICRQIVKAHGGTISVDNADDGGAVLTVRLPLNESHMHHEGDAALGSDDLDQGRARQAPDLR